MPLCKIWENGVMRDAREDEMFMFTVNPDKETTAEDIKEALEALGVEDSNEEE